MAYPYSRDSFICFLVIPHYRDTKRLKPYLDDLVTTLPEWVTIQVSDDGSGPACFQALKDLIDKVRQKSTQLKAAPTVLRPIQLKQNKGKGAAVLAGWKKSLREQFLCFVDADGAVSARELCRALTYMCHPGSGLDVLIGSRLQTAGNIVERRLARHLGGRIFASVVSLISGLTVYDTQCGLKILTREVYQSIASHVNTPGFAFDVELLMLAMRMGFVIEEFPVNWRDIPGGRVSLLKHSLPMLAEVGRAKKNVDRVIPLKSRSFLDDAYSKKTGGILI